MFQQLIDHRLGSLRGILKYQPIIAGTAVKDNRASCVNNLEPSIVCGDDAAVKVIRVSTEGN